MINVHYYSPPLEVNVADPVVVDDFENIVAQFFDRSLCLLSIAKMEALHSQLVNHIVSSVAALKLVVVHLVGEQLMLVVLRVCVVTGHASEFDLLSL